MRVYIAGPMRGYAYFNFPAFDAKRDELRAAGHVPVSPADLDRAIGFDPMTDSVVSQIMVDKAFLRSAVQRDVAALLECDALVLLEGWEHSSGARGEKAIAEWIGIRVLYPGRTLEELAAA